MVTALRKDVPTLRFDSTPSTMRLSCAFALLVPALLVGCGSSSEGTASDSSDAPANGNSKPNAPTAVVAAATGSGVLTVSWAHVAESYWKLSGFNVNISTSPTGTFTVPAGTCATVASSKTSKSCTATGLTPGTTYYFRVSAKSTATSGWSAVSAGAIADAPGAPGTPTGVGSTGFGTVNWTAPTYAGATAITGYRVELAGDPALPFAVAAGCESASTSTALTCTATGLNSKNYFRVAAINSLGVGAYSTMSANVETSKLAAAPDAPTGTPGVNEVALEWQLSSSWVGVAPIVGFVVEASTSAAGPFTTPAGCDLASTSEQTCTATGLTGGTTYYFRVATKNSVGVGAYSPVSLGITPSSN